MSQTDETVIRNTSIAHKPLRPPKTLPVTDIRRTTQSAPVVRQQPKDRKTGRSVPK